MSEFEITVEEIKSFNQKDWEFEYSSGYAGFRNNVNNIWIYGFQHKSLENYSKQYNDELKLLSNFRTELESSQKWDDYKMINFLDEKYKKILNQNHHYHD